MKKLYLVDVSAMYFRAFYAIRALSNPKGMPVNALYGFLSMTVKLLREIKPDYMAYCFDMSGPSFRVDIDPNYKANRKEMPAELVPQVPYVRKLVDALGIPAYECKGFEADDIIGTLTRFGRDNDLEVVIVSSDKDFGQLVKPFVSMYDTMKDVRYDEAGVIEKWGIEPRKMIDYLAIVGDTSDNVPGVAGIGEKGAQKLLAEFESLEDIYENLEKVSAPALKKKLEASRANAFMSKKLVTIVCDMDLSASMDKLRLRSIHREELRDLLAELDFKSFAKTLLGADAVAPALADGESAAPTVMGPTEGGATLAHTLNPDGKEISTIAGSALAASDFVRKVPPAAPVVSSSTLSLGPMTEERLDLPQLEKWLKAGVPTWAMHTERGSYFAQEHKEGWAIAEIAAEGTELGRMIDEKRLKLRGFDIKDFAKRHSMRKADVDWDQMLAAYVIRAGNIEALAPLFTLYNGEALPDLPSPSQLLTANIRLEMHLRKKLTTINGEKILFEIEQPLVPILLAMENTGILIDQPALKKQSESLGRDLLVLEKDIHAAAGGAFNIGSPKQLGQVLFEKMKLPTGKKTKTGYSTDNDVLEKLALEHPFARKLIEWRELSKLRSTYVDALPQLVNKNDGRVHTTFSQAVSATGRLSSVNPNLQNIPIRTERGNEIRKAFVADPGHELISADYSQIELRVLAHITGDPGLMRAFEQNVDVHTATASEVFEVAIKDVTPEMRRKAKAVNFCLAYGQSAFGLAETLGIPRAEATEIINRYFSRFSGVQTYMTETVEEAQKKGYVETIFGRRRYLDELYSKAPAVRKFGERAAINAPIQGAASDLVKMAMIKVGIPKHARPLLQVHDELVMEVEEAHVDELCLEIASKMESAVELKVPLKVNTGSGKNWQDAH
jgi:DNA polymerase-1